MMTLVERYKNGNDLVTDSQFFREMSCCHLVWILNGCLGWFVLLPSLVGKGCCHPFLLQLFIKNLSNSWRTYADLVLLSVKSGILPLLFSKAFIQ